MHLRGIKKLWHEDTQKLNLFTSVFFVCGPSIWFYVISYMVQSTLSETYFFERAREFVQRVMTHIRNARKNCVKENCEACVKFDRSSRRKKCDCWAGRLSKAMCGEVLGTENHKNGEKGPCWDVSHLPRAQSQHSIIDSSNFYDEILNILAFICFLGKQSRLQSSSALWWGPLRHTEIVHLGTAAPTDLKLKLKKEEGMAFPSAQNASSQGWPHWGIS